MTSLDCFILARPRLWIRLKGLSGRSKRTTNCGDGVPGTWGIIGWMCDPPADTLVRLPSHRHNITLHYSYCKSIEMNTQSKTKVVYLTALQVEALLCHRGGHQARKHTLAKLLQCLALRLCCAS